MENVLNSELYILYCNLEISSLAGFELLMDLLPNEQNFDPGKSRQNFPCVIQND
jgi:hypothetical protein